MYRVIGLFLGMLWVGYALAEDPPDHAVWSKGNQGREVDFSQLVDLEGHAFIPSSDSPVLAHYWATWCGPCIEEFPKLDQVSQRLGERRLEVVAISEDKGGADDVKQFLAKHPGITHVRILLDPKRKMAKALNISVLPTSILAQGNTEKIRIVGSAAWDDADLKTLGDNIGN